VKVVVELKIHNWYSIDEALGAFNASAPEFHCDKQFVVVPQAVLCFATIGETSSQSHVPSPSSLTWRPLRLDYEPGDSIPWLPKSVREVCDRSRKPIQKLREHHVFLRKDKEGKFLYAGVAHLGSYECVRTGDPAKLSANFSLNAKLPRDAWLKFGGYPGWLVEVNHRCHRLGFEDTAIFEKLVQELPSQEFSHLSLTRYEEDSLTLHTNATRGWLMYLERPDDGGIYVRDPGWTGDAERQEIFRCGCGIDLEFPAQHTLPRELAIAAVVEFFKTRQLPRRVDWDAHA